MKSCNDTVGCPGRLFDNSSLADLDPVVSSHPSHHGLAYAAHRNLSLKTGERLTIA